MSNTQRTMKLGQLSELQDQLRRLENRARGIVESLNLSTFVSPMSSPFDLNAQRILDYADELKPVIDQGNQIRAAIDELKEELGVR